SIIEALVFARRNGMLTSHSHVALYPAHNPVTQYELRSLLQDIMEIPLPGKKSIDFTSDQTPLRWHLFVNPGVNPQQSLSRRGLQKISNRDDALGFSSSRENLVQSVELLTITSWGEWQVSYYSGADTVHEAMLQVLNFRSKADAQAWPEWHIHCHCQVRSVAIQKRLEKLLSDLIDHLSQTKPAPYLLQTGDSFHLIEYRRREVVSHHAENLKALIKLLARPRPRFRRWHLDSHALPSSPLRLILEQGEGDQWHVWYWRQKGKVFLYVMDQYGSLHYQEQSGSDIRSTLVPLLRFIRRLNQRWADELQQERWPLYLSELLLDGETLSFSAERRRIPVEAREPATIEVSAKSHTKSALEISVNGVTLSQATSGTQLLQEARQAIIAARAHDHAQPVWLSDITIDDNRHLTRHLQFRQRLEHLLNHPSSAPSSPARKGRAQAQT
ncbi:MAG: class I adenylate cyclase, partial [Pseudomonadota bacterium]|nr:class I adenylate cyclase [Pseudomonadota bacterium]